MPAIELVPQSYGIAMAQCVFGGPRGIWLECTGCDVSHRLKGASIDIPDYKAAEIFREHGWTGRGNKMFEAKCPKCNGSPA